MTDQQQPDNSRRAFFMRSGVALGAGIGAGLASTGAVAGTWTFDSSLSLKEQVSRLQQQLSTMEDREAVRQLYLSYTSLMQHQAYEAVVELFAEDATVQLDGTDHQGKQHAIRQLFTQDYASRQADQLQTAFQHELQRDSITVDEGLQRAHATFHAKVRIDRPITDDSSLGQMARLQGLSSESRWQSGRFEVDYVRQQDQWKISRLFYRNAIPDQA